MSSKEGSPGITNPMLYDPMPEGDHQTNKLMQFVAATIGNFILSLCYFKVFTNLCI